MHSHSKLLQFALSGGSKSVLKTVHDNKVHDRFGSLSLFVSYAMLMRPKKPKQMSMAASNQAHYFYGSLKPATNVAIVPNIVASS